MSKTKCESGCCACGTGKLMAFATVVIKRVRKAEAMCYMDIEIDDADVKRLADAGRKILPDKVIAELIIEQALKEFADCFDKRKRRKKK